MISLKVPGHRRCHVQQLFCFTQPFYRCPLLTGIEEMRIRRGKVHAEISGEEKEKQRLEAEIGLLTGSIA